MSAITFPTPATLNAEHTVGSRKWKFNGTAWKLVPKTTDGIVEGSTNLFFTNARVADAPSVTGLGTRMTTAETNITALQGTLGGIAGAFNYVGTLTGGADAASATNLAALTQKDTGDYYKVTTAGYFIIAPAAAFYANIGDGLVFNNSNGVDKIDNTNSTVAGTANFVSVSGSQDTGYTVDLDSTFKTRITDLETGKQIKDVVNVTAPAHSAGLRWIDPTDMSEYLSYNNAWVELDKQ